LEQDFRRTSRPHAGRRSLAWLWIAEVFSSAAALWQGREIPAVRNNKLSSSPLRFAERILAPVFYPAVMSFDALGQWRQALPIAIRAGAPPVAMLMRFTQHLLKARAFSAFIQGLLFWGLSFS